MVQIRFASKRVPSSADSRCVTNILLPFACRQSDRIVIIAMERFRRDCVLSLSEPRVVGPGFPAWPNHRRALRPGWKAWPHQLKRGEGQMHTRLQIALWSAAAVIGLSYSDSEAANAKAKTAPTKTTAVAA